MAIRVPSRKPDLSRWSFDGREQHKEDPRAPQAPAPEPRPADRFERGERREEQRPETD